MEISKSSLKQFLRSYPGLSNFLRIIRDYRYIYHIFQGYLVTVEHRDKWKNIERRFLRKKKLFQYNDTNTITDTSNIEALKKDGVILNPSKLSIDTADLIRDKLKNFACHDPDKPELGYFKIDKKPSNVARAYYKCQDLVKVPEIMEIANDPKIIAYASEYFGALSRIDSIYAWWSFPSDGPVATQAFHRDIDTLHALKYMIYLTDVDEDSGPHVYIKGSFRQNFLTSKDKSHNNQEILKKFGSDSQLRLVGERGYNFIGDMFSFHKGCPPLSKPRLLLQVYYSLVQTPFGPKKPFIKASLLNHISDNKRFRHINKNIIEFDS
jgi:hypothetical protein